MFGQEIDNDLIFRIMKLECKLNSLARIQNIVFDEAGNAIKVSPEEMEELCN